jgi:hypothetical protein
MKAYMLDEFAATFLMIHSATVLEGISGLVLRHDERGRNVDAEHVHFFHEKVPPGKVLPRDTDLAPLDRVVDARPDEAALLRTRAVVKIFKEEPDLKGAEQDLAKALQLMEQQRHEITIPPTLQPGQKLKYDEMPSSLESQLRWTASSVESPTSSVPFRLSKKYFRPLPARISLSIERQSVSTLSMP